MSRNKENLKYVLIFTGNGILIHSIRLVHLASTNGCNQSKMVDLTIVEGSMFPRIFDRWKGDHLFDTLRAE